MELWLGKLPGEVYFGEIEKKKGKNSETRNETKKRKKAEKKLVVELEEKKKVKDVMELQDVGYIKVKE